MSGAQAPTALLLSSADIGEAISLLLAKRGIRGEFTPELRTRTENGVGVHYEMALLPVVRFTGKAGAE